MKRISFLLIAGAASLAFACGGSPGQVGDDDDGSGSGSGSGSGDEWDQLLGTRVHDYNAALRIAALRLTGDLPTMDEMNQIASKPDDASKKTAYESLIQNYMGRPQFARQMVAFWRDTFKMGETAELDTAPALAAQLSVNNGSYMSLFTQASGNCPTFNVGTGAFTPAECTGTGPQAGVLANPAVMKQFASNFAFRRVRWIQETFDCAKFPIEQTGGTPTDVGAAAGPYTGLWPFTSIAGTDTGGKINFRDVSAVTCANCHTTINHIAPLFAMFDPNGVYQTKISVPTPLDGSPLAVIGDYLVAGETTAWRYQQPAATIPELGARMAADPAVATCGVARMWNWALGKTDIVDTLEIVPSATIETQVTAFTTGGFKMKDLIYAVFTAEDFTLF